MTSASAVGVGGVGRWGMGYCAALTLLATGATAQGMPRFAASQLTCAVFTVSVRTRVTTDLQGHRQVEQVRRDGRLVVQGTPVDSGTAIEAWWDSLALWRQAGTQRLTPDASGILGGRYRGILHPDGRFTRTEAPWVPDEVAEVSDLSVALDDLFPTDSGATVRDLGAKRGIHRFRIERSRDLSAPADSARPFDVIEKEDGTGEGTWSAEGLLTWTRTVNAETRVRETPRRSFRSVALQQIDLRRVGGCPGG